MSLDILFIKAKNFNTKEHTHRMLKEKGYSHKAIKAILK
jgi:hypothetical protein